MFNEVSCRLFESGPTGPIAILAKGISRQRLSEMPFVLNGHRKFSIGLTGWCPIAADIDIVDETAVDLEEVDVIAVTLGDHSSDQQALAWSENDGWFTVDRGIELIWNIDDAVESESTAAVTWIDEEMAFDWLNRSGCFVSTAWPALFDAYAEVRPFVDRAVRAGILYSDGWHPAHADHQASVAAANARGDLSAGERLIFDAMLEERTGMEIPLDRIGTVPAFRNERPSNATVADRLVTIRKKVRRHGFDFAINSNPNEGIGYFRWEKRADQLSTGQQKS